MRCCVQQGRRVGEVSQPALRVFLQNLRSKVSSDSLWTRSLFVLGPGEHQRERECDIRCYPLLAVEAAKSGPFCGEHILAGS